MKRPNNIVGEFVFPIRKPEQMVDLLKENGIPVASKIMLEGGELPYADYMRLASLFPGSEVVDGTAIIREARSVKLRWRLNFFVGRLLYMLEHIVRFPMYTIRG